jgi:hypothetical protein
MKRQQTATRRQRALARKPAPASKETTVREPVSGNSQTELTPEEIDRMIATAAYARAEKRGFTPGHALEDWLAAEGEVRARLATGLRPGDA